MRLEFHSKLAISASSFLIVVNCIVLITFLSQAVSHSSYLVKNNIKKDNEAYIKYKTIRNIGAVCILLFCLSSFAWLFRELCIIPSDIFEFECFDISSYIDMNIETITCISVLFFEIWRLKILFSNSAQFIHNTTLFLLIIGMIIALASLSFSSFQNNLNMKYEIAISVGSFFVLGIPIVVTILFYIKLFKIIITIRKESLAANQNSNIGTTGTTDNTINNTNNRNNTNADTNTDNNTNNTNNNYNYTQSNKIAKGTGLNDNLITTQTVESGGTGPGEIETIMSISNREAVVLENIVKQALLTFWEVICFPLWIFFAIYFKISVNNIVTDMALFVASICVKVLTFAVPSICIWLSFIFSERQYFKICNKCHYCLLKCCERRAKYRLHKLRDDINSQRYQEQVGSLLKVTSITDVVDITQTSNTMDMDVPSVSQSNPYLQHVHG